MKKHVIVLSSILLLMGFSIKAQNNLDVSFATFPDFLNVCGDSDEEIVTISLAGSSTEIRSNINATVHFFHGVELVNFNSAASTAGVTLLDNSDPSNPVFSLPDLDPLGLTSADLSLEIRAQCGYIDTLHGGTGIFDVVDEWEFSYDLGTSIGLSEIDSTELYRDALAFPILNLDVNNTFGPAKLNDCYSRDITLQNAGLAGTVDTLVYENIQGAGVYINNILVNGNPVAFSKSLFNGDTIVTFGLGAIEFASIASGNGDGIFDPNETLIIQEDLCLVDCLGDRASSHNISWGCDGRFCETVSAADFVAVGQGAADVQVYQTGSVPDQDAGYCQSGSSTLVFTNEGIEIDAGFATMLDVSTGISLAYVGNMGLLSDNGITITEVYIGGVLLSSPTFLNDLDNNALFSSDPDGPGGLSDFDGDSFFDDLEINESVEITVNFDFDCSQATGLDDNCVNEFVTNFSGIINFTNLCGDRLERLNLNYASITHKKTEETYQADPDAFMATDTFFLDYQQKRRVEGFARSCSDMEEYRIEVVLPTGINLLPGATSFLIGNNVPLTMISNVMSNDTLFLSFHASPSGVPDIPLLHNIQLAFQADCSSSVGPTTFPFKLSHYCPDCDCEHLWHCEEFVGPSIHTSNPPCPPLVCPVGVQATSFNVERTTFGFQDTNYGIPLTAAQVNTKAALACDSVEMTITNIVGDTPLTDSIGMVITYNNPDGSTAPEESFLFASGNLEIIQGATTTNCAVNFSQLTVTSIDSIKYLNFDLNDCLVSSGITLNPGDELNFVAKFTVNANAPLESSKFSEVPNLRGWGYGTVDGVDHACDNYGDVFTLGSLLISTAYPNAATQIRGCQEVTLNVQVITQLNDYTDVFGFEHRPVIQVDSLVIDYDPSILESFGQFQPSLIMPDHPIYGDNPIPMPPVESFTPGRYVIYLDTLNWGPSILSASSTYPFNFSISAIPNCQTDFGNGGGGNIYPFNPGLHFYEYAYARSYGDGSCSNYIEENTVGQTIQYGNPPEMNFIPVTSPTYTLLKDTAEWIVQYCNTTNDADIGFTWLAVEDTLGGVEVVSVEDISLPGSPVDLAISNYGTMGNNFVVYTDGLLRSNGANGLEEVCNTIKIRAIVTQCGTLNFVTKTGWDCLAPDPGWSPLDYDPCTAEEIEMSIINREPFIDADIEQEPSLAVGLCEDNEIIIRVKNTQQGTLYDLETSITVPPGVGLVPGSFQIAYPFSSAYVNVSADPVFTGSNALGDIFQFSDFSDLSSYLDQFGLQGSNAVMPSDSNEFLLRFLITTDCDFIANNRVYYNLRGVKGCGDFSNTESGETLPLSVSGLPAPGDNGFDIGFDNGTGLVPGELSTIGIFMTNTNSNATDADDFVSLELPDNIIYQNGSSVGIQPSGWIPGDPVIELSGSNILYTWPMPVGLMQNETAILNITVLSPDYACSISSLAVNLNTFVRTIVNCTTTMMDCEIESLTSSNNGASTNLNILQQSLEFAMMNFTSECVDGSSELVQVNGSLYNAGDPITASNVNVNYFYDDDGNGVLDGTEPLVSSGQVNGPIASLSSMPFSHSFSVDLTEICGIIVQVDSTGLGLCAASEFPLGTPTLINAGNDELFCAALATTINTILGDTDCVSLPGYVFSWSAVAPALDTDLSDINIANPLLTVNHDAIVEDTLQYVLTTTRPGCGATIVTSDTVSIIRALAVELNVTSPVSTNPGVPVTIGVNASNGALPYAYSWTPVAGLDNPSSPNPTATVSATTTYQVEVTSATGCSSIEQVTVLIENCITPVTNSLILTKTNCAGANGSAVIRLAQDEANYSYTWTPDIGIANSIGNERTSLPVGSYSVDISSIAGAGCSSELNFIIAAYDAPQVDTITTPATCSSTDGTAILSPDTLVYEWSDLGSGATRTDLGSGTYYVTAYDAADPDCKNVIEVKIDEVSDLIASIAVDNHASSCTSSDGAATITVSGGSGSYSYSWSSGTSTNANLSPGVHVVTVSDTGGAGCDVELIVAINGGLNLASVNVLGVTDIACAGSANGFIGFDLIADPMVFVPADTIFTNGVDSFENGIMSGGNYCLLVVDSTGCIGASHCFEIIEPQQMQLVFTVDPPCPGNGEIELTVIGGTPDFAVDWADLPGNMDPEDRVGLDIGTYAVLVTDANGCFVNENEIILNTCPTSCDYFFGLQDLVLFAASCDELTEICLDITSDDIDQFNIYDNGVLYGGNFMGCNFDTSYSYVYTAVLLNLPPPYTVVSWIVNGNDYSGDFDTFQALRDSMNVWDENGNWILEAGANTIYGGNASNSYGALEIISQSGFSAEPLVPFETVNSNSMALVLGTGPHIIIVTDTIGGCSDTLNLEIECPPYQLQYDTLCIGDAFTFSIDTSLLDLQGIVLSSSNICSVTSPTSVIFVYDEVGHSLAYGGIEMGTDTACIEFITDAGIRDTMYFHITVENCQGLTCDTVYINQTKEYCLDASNLNGPITSISNICEDQSGQSVEITWDTGTGCIQFTGLELGIDSACVQFCDEFGACDTTYLCFETVPYFDPPIANDDSTSTFSGDPVVIDFKANDILYGGVDTAYILTGPSYGTLGTSPGGDPLNPDCTVTYTADEDICERWDEFTYVVCTPNGCDQATVYIWIACSDIVIFTGVSPNGDGVNDFFHIGGIEEYPDNELQIFNRWGNLIYNTKNYKNNWDGRWNDSRELPDGSYFYILRLNDPAGRSFNGYFELYR